MDCDNSRVIEIVRANYGRLSTNVCTSPQTSPSSSSLGECLHRSSKSVLDRVCGGRSSCTVRASEDLFQTRDCPQVEKYLEVHFRCVSVRGEGGTRRHLIPPWLEDLSATFRPVTRVAPSSPTTVTTSTTASTSTSITETISDNTRPDDDHQNIVNSETPITAGNVSRDGDNKGRYFLIAQEGQEIEGDQEPSTTLIITVTISTVTTVLSILIIIQLCRKFRGKSDSCEQPTEESCYQCQTEVRTTDVIPVIPVQNILYSPVSATEPAEYHQYRSLPFHINKLDNGLRRSTTEDSAIYGYRNRPDDNESDGVYQTNNESDGIYHIPFIDTNNYMRTNILHTQLYGDKGTNTLPNSDQNKSLRDIPTVEKQIDNI